MYPSTHSTPGQWFKCWCNVLHHLSSSGISSPNDVSDLHFTRPSRRCQLVCLHQQTVSHVFWGQNPQDIQHPGLLRAALLTTDRTWLRRPLLLLQHLRTVPRLVLDWCDHAGLVHGHGGDRGRPGTSRSQSCEGLCHLSGLCPSGFRSVWRHFGFVGFPLKTAAQVKMTAYIVIKLKQLEYQLAKIMLISYKGVVWFQKMIHFLVNYVWTFID